MTGLVTAVLNVIVTVPTAFALFASNVAAREALPAAPLSKVPLVTPPAAVFSVLLAMSMNVPVDPLAFVNVTVVVMPSVVFVQSFAAVAPFATQVPEFVFARMPAYSGFSRAFASIEPEVASSTQSPPASSPPVRLTDAATSAPVRSENARTKSMPPLPAAISHP